MLSGTTAEAREGLPQSGAAEARLPAWEGNAPPWAETRMGETDRGAARGGRDLPIGAAGARPRPPRRRADPARLRGGREGARRAFAGSSCLYLWRSGAPQLLLPESSSLLPVSLSLSLSLCLSLARSRSPQSGGFTWNQRGRPDQPENRAGSGGGDQRPRDHARAVTASAPSLPPPRGARRARGTNAQARVRAGQAGEGGGSESGTVRVPGRRGSSAHARVRDHPGPERVKSVPKCRRSRPGTPTSCHAHMAILSADC